MQAQVKKFTENEELKEAGIKSVEELSARHKTRLAYEQLLLGAPDEYLKQKFEELDLKEKGVSFDEFIKTIHEERERNPDFLEPLGPEADGQFYMISSGASYPSATLTANLTGSYLFTDIHSKWKEIELDRKSQSAINKIWAPFAKALQNTPLKYLNNLRLEHALTLRREGRLESLRGFLAKVWKGARTEKEFDSENALLLSEELGIQIRAAEQEWKQLDRDLLKFISPFALSGLLSAGPLIATGHAEFLAAAAAVAGGLSLAGSRWQRRLFPDRFPAAFFMKIDKDGA